MQQVSFRVGFRVGLGLLSLLGLVLEVLRVGFRVGVVVVFFSGLVWDLFKAGFGVYLGLV